MNRSYKFRLLPNESQKDRLLSWIEGCRELYNGCLQERQEAWKKAHKSISAYDQMKELPEVKDVRPDLKDINAQILQAVCKQADRSFQNFFRRVKKGQTPGYPRFKSRKRFNSFTHPQASQASRTDRSIRIPSFGYVRWKLWKPLDQIGKPKTLTVKKEADGWYVILSCEVDKPASLPETGKTIGVDLGLDNLVATSEGEVLGDLEPLKQAAKRLKRYQRVVSRRQKGSNRRAKAVQILARRSQDLARKRKAQLDVISKRLINENDVIVVEDLDVIHLINLGGQDAQGRGLRRNWRHAAIATLIHQLDYKAEEAGRRVIKVDPRGTSQECSCCGGLVPKSLGVRVHRCVGCGLILDRDHNAALNVLKRGLQLQRGESKDSLKREDEVG